MLRNTRPIFDVVLDHRFSDPITRFVTVPIQGILSPSVQVQLMKDMPKSVSDAVATALGWKLWRRPINGGKRGGMQRNLWQQLQLHKVTTLKKESVDEPRRVEQPSKFAHRNRDIVCWHCNEKGHVKRNCGKRPLNWSGSVGKVYRRPRM